MKPKLIPPKRMVKQAAKIYQETGNFRRVAEFLDCNPPTAKRILVEAGAVEDRNYVNGRKLKPLLPKREFLRLVKENPTMSGLMRRMKAGECYVKRHFREYKIKTHVSI